MGDTVLLRFLRKGLVEVGGDDAKLAKLQNTSAAVSAMLKDMPSKTASFVLIAFDANAPANDPVIVETLECLNQEWPTYVNTFSGTPVTVLRAVILDALVGAAREDERVAVAFAASARNMLSFMETGNELAIWVDIVNEVEAAVDKRAEQEWETPASIQIGALQLESPAI